jgi:hypothetical protein
VLFDVDGAWYAADAAQQAALHAYCAWAQDKPVDERRRLLPRPTPFSAMTAEFALKSGSRIARSKCVRGGAVPSGAVAETGAAAEDLAVEDSCREADLPQEEKEVVVS